MMDTTIDKGKLIGNRYATAACAGCGQMIPRGDTIAYFGDAPRGRRAWHPKCVTVDPEVQALLRAVARAEQAAAKADLTMGTEARRAAVVEAYRAICDWLSRPAMAKLRDLLVAEVTRPRKRVEEPKPPPPMRTRPNLRLVVGGGAR